MEYSGNGHIHEQPNSMSWKTHALQDVDPVLSLGVSHTLSEVVVPTLDLLSPMDSRSTKQRNGSLSNPSLRSRDACGLNGYFGSLKGRMTYRFREAPPPPETSIKRHEAKVSLNEPNEGIFIFPEIYNPIEPPQNSPHAPRPPVSKTGTATTGSLVDLDLKIGAPITTYDQESCSTVPHGEDIPVYTQADILLSLGMMREITNDTSEKPSCKGIKLLASEPPQNSPQSPSPPGSKYGTATPSFLLDLNLKIGRPITIHVQDSGPTVPYGKEVPGYTFPDTSPSLRTMLETQNDTAEMPSCKRNKVISSHGEGEGTMTEGFNTAQLTPADLAEPPSGYTGKMEYSYLERLQDLQENQLFSSTNPGRQGHSRAEKKDLQRPSKILNQIITIFRRTKYI